jgi:hypothetical protein
MEITAKSIYNPIIEDIAHAAAEDMRMEIDFGIFSSAAKVYGWTEIELTTSSLSHLIEIHQWAKENCGFFKNLGTKFIFESDKDAALFALKWC